ncbi:hypothetical protein TNCV_196381 [Trichonephila clavipes]|uniref:Uncharacterized protein n=1 Tax=Trichonephila clavipes TaxID=2585209 RepID=A0A8X7BLF3_TRICX|nr:hypothetical protein TNCV_196381 [Trichonephila clavipes]
MFFGGVTENIRAPQQSQPSRERTESPLVKLMEGKIGGKPLSDHPQGVLSQSWGGTEQNRTILCMVLEAKTNDTRKNLAFSRDEFRGP